MRLTLLAGALFAALVSCDSGVVGSSSTTGAYTLRTINGASLPYTISGSGANKTEILDDVITLFEGFTYNQLAHSRVTTNGQETTVTKTESGSFSVFGTSVTLTSSNGASVRRGLIESGEMRLVEAGVTSVYKK